VVPDESTASDAVQLLKLVSDAAGRRDLGAITALYAPDGVWDLSPIGMGTFEGHAAIRGFMEDWFGSYEEWEREAEELLDVGNGVAFAVWLQRGRPGGSSGEVRLRYAAVLLCEAGKIARVTNYTDIDEARGAAERLAQERAPDG
jgi:ketosteroid isomerase-like protein